MRVGKREPEMERKMWWSIDTFAVRDEGPCDLPRGESKWDAF